MRVVLCSLLALTASACDDGVTPSLYDFRFDGQSPDSASVLLLSTGFRDGDGDLAGGNMETFIDARPTNAGALDLRPIFAFSGLADGATEGRIEFVLELNVATGEAPPPGTTFRLGIRVSDAAKNTSPTSEITLKLNP
jgi:hypothetical protein